MTHLPDQNHIDEICRRLWCDREFGRAAVMIGAGFSRNAEKISPSSPDFPLWFELEKKLQERLYPQGNGSSNPLRLASEYKATFGQQALNDFLLESVPDDDYIPGKLHKLLLNLPWSDVFTTNYDTLIERTRSSVYEQKYDVIHTCEDLPRGMKPRIVKLHGSFPSYRPFIFTEEDYRTYPRQFAPFVNTVQQSMMENTFCLLGFSGEDPNFLNWLGWIRDNLGESVPPIYLCGVLDLSNTARQLYTQRGIIPIDLAPLFPRDKYSDHNLRYSSATEWLLQTLLRAEPLDRTSWPRPPASSRSADLNPSEGLPHIPTSNILQSSLGEFQPKSGEISSHQAKSILNEWKLARKDYPGWIIAPSEKREYLWTWTKFWISPIIRSLRNFEPVLAILILYELNWRLECALTPLLFRDWEEAISSTLVKTNPFNIQDSSLELALSNNDLLNQLNNENISSEEFREYWICMAFAIMRRAREELDELKFNKWKDLLTNSISSNANWKARWFYEQALWYLFQFEIEPLKGLLDRWPAEERLTLWEIRRSFVWAEVGDLKTAKQIASRALDLVREALQRTPFDDNLLSQEAWAILILQIIVENELDGFNTEKIFINQYYHQTYTVQKMKYINSLNFLREMLLNSINQSGGPEVLTLMRQYPCIQLLHLLINGKMPLDQHFH